METLSSTGRWGPWGPEDRKERQQKQHRLEKVQGEETVSRGARGTTSGSTHRMEHSSGKPGHSYGGGSRRVRGSGLAGDGKATGLHDWEDTRGLRRNALHEDVVPGGGQ